MSSPRSKYPTQRRPVASTARAETLRSVKQSSGRLKDSLPTARCLARIDRGLGDGVEPLSGGKQLLDAGELARCGKLAVIARLVLDGEFQERHRPWFRRVLFLSWMSRARTNAPGATVRTNRPDIELGNARGASHVRATSGRQRWRRRARPAIRWLRQTNRRCRRASGRHRGPGCRSIGRIRCPPVP